MIARSGRRGVARLLLSAVVLAVTGVGCSLLVSGNVADYQCFGSDPSSCPSGMRCDNVKNRCVSADGSVSPMEAGDEVATSEAGDAGKDAPDAPSQFDLGTKCRVDNDCKSRLCGSSTILTTTITQTTGPICTTPCCNSGECPSTFVCFNGGTGGAYCVPQTLAQRTAPASGGKSGGLVCATNSECRSGFCDKPDGGGSARCLDTCCVASECGGTSTCRLKTVAAPGPSHDVWVCAPAEPGATTQPSNVVCADSTECTSDACIGFSPSRFCRPPCSNTASCKTVAFFAAGHCLYGSSGSDAFRFCSTGTINSRSPAGVACPNDDSACQSDYCDPELKKCANVCGRDSDCAPNESCRPSAAGTPFLRCVPKP